MTRTPYTAPSSILLGRLFRTREAVLASLSRLIREETVALQHAMEGGVRSLEQASQAVESALGGRDEVLPASAWERIRAQLAAARSEADWR